MLDALRVAHPDTEWTWVLGACALMGGALISAAPLADATVTRAGADTFTDLLAGKWKDGERFRRGVNLVVVPRPGVLCPDAETAGVSALLVYSSLSFHA